MKKQWFVLSAILVLAVLAIYQSAAVNKEEVAKVGFKAPQFNLQGLNGQPYSLDQLGGKPVVINFWASWCGPCRVEAPELVKLYKKYGKQVEIYAVNLTASDSIEGAKAFANEFGFTFPVLLDDQGEVAKAYRITPIPTTFFVNGDGIIADKVTGLIDPQTLEAKFKQLIR